MKKITTLLLVMLCLFGAVKAQDVTVFNYDGVTATASFFDGWYSGDTFVSDANPHQDVVNGSANAGKYTHNGTWSNMKTTSQLNLSSLEYPSYEVSVYTPTSTTGTVVIACYDASGNQLDWYSQPVTTAGAWIKYTRNINFLNNVASIKVAFNYGSDHTGTSDDIVYIDNLVFKHIDNSSVKVFDFDGVTPTTSSWSDSFVSAANPVSDGVNSTANVGKYTHNNAWSNVTLTSPVVSIDSRVYTSYELSIYSPAAGTLTIALYNAANAQLEWYSQSVSVSAGWNKIAHTLPFVGTIAKVMVAFNYGSNPAGNSNDVVYLDNLVFKKPASYTLYNENFNTSWAGNWGNDSWAGSPSTVTGQWFGGVNLQTTDDATMTLDQWWGDHGHILNISSTAADVIIPDLNVAGFDSLKLSFDVRDESAKPIIDVKVGSGDWVSVATSQSWSWSWKNYVLLLKDASGNPIGNVNTISIRLSHSSAGSLIYDNVKILGQLHYRFTGATSSDPTVSTNWSGGFIPRSQATDDFIVSDGNLVLDQNATYISITVNPTAKLTLNSGKSLRVATLALKSNATGTATFVDSNATPATISATVQQYLPETNRNWYVSSPISSATNVNLATGASVVEYDEEHGTWPSVSGTLNPMKGYISTSGSAGTGTINFSGNLNSGPKSVTLSKKGLTKIGFNLVGNPYPSYLMWTEALANSANCLTTIWYKTKSAGVYSFQTYNASGDVGVPLSTSGYIPPMQAFWVRTSADGSTLAVDNSMRSHGNGSSNLLKAPANKTAGQLVRLQVSNGTNTDETVIYFNANADNGFDSFDSPKMSANNASIPEIYTTAGTEQLVINGMKTITENAVIPLGFGTGTSSDFTLAATELKNIDSGMHVILKDNSLKKETELADGITYNFSSEVIASNTGRFSLIFRASGVATDVSNTNLLKAQTFVNAANQIVIVTSGNCNYAIFNSVGQKVSEGFTTTSHTNVSGLQAGMYVVKLSASGRSYCSKVIIK